MTNHLNLDWPIKTMTIHVGINTIIWQRLFTWLWRWLPLRSKHQSPTTVFLKTTLTWMITQDKQLIFLGSNHLPCCCIFLESFRTPLMYRPVVMRSGEQGYLNANNIHVGCVFMSIFSSRLASNNRKSQEYSCLSYSLKVKRVKVT